jgi:hypothetical protein
MNAAWWSCSDIKMGRSWRSGNNGLTESEPSPVDRGLGIRDWFVWSNDQTESREPQQACWMACWESTPFTLAKEPGSAGTFSN